MDVVEPPLELNSSGALGPAERATLAPQRAIRPAYL